MLTFAALQNVAFIDSDYEPMCMECAGERHGALLIAKLDARLVDGDHVGVRSMIEYEADEADSEQRWRYAESLAEDGGYVHDGQETLTDVDEIAEALEEDGFAMECGGGCGKVYTGGVDPWQKRVDGKVPARIGSANDNRWTL